MNRITRPGRQATTAVKARETDQSMVEIISKATGLIPLTVRDLIHYNNQQNAKGNDQSTRSGSGRGSTDPLSNMIEVLPLAHRNEEDKKLGQTQHLYQTCSSCNLTLSDELFKNSILQKTTPTFGVKGRSIVHREQLNKHNMSSTFMVHFIHSEINYR
jgi:hypothetical protein